MPSFIVEQNWNDSRLIIDHWRALQLPEVVEQFQMIEHLDLVERVLTSSNLAKNRRYCSGSECEQGVMYENQCRQENAKCALMVSSFPGRGPRGTGILRVLKPECVTSDMLLPWVQIFPNLLDLLFFP